MSDLGQPRKAQHKASAFAGLLKPVAELAPETGAGAAINDRLHRAAAKRPGH